MSYKPNPFGSLFSEEIVKEVRRKKTLRNFVEEPPTPYNRRLIVFVFVLIFGLGILFIKVFTLTIIEGRRYRQAALGNRIRETKIRAPRGIIYDRKGVSLVRNIPTFLLSNGEVYFEENKGSNSGRIVESVAREYIYGELTSHVLGYTAEISPEELAESREKTDGVSPDYKAGDIVGKTGIELSYNSLLRGKDGKELVEVDAFENIVRVLGKVEPEPGKNISLSLDINLQRIAREELLGKKGAVVVEDPETGAVLSLYSSPSFDANKFIRGEGLEEILEDEERPLFNRAISGEYPPGSAFKIITAIAALEEGTVEKDTQFEDTGILTVGRFSYGNWYFTQYGKKEGMVDIVKALKRSNDIFFYKAGEGVGIDKLSMWAKKLGLGFLGIDIPAEAEGLMPDPSWQKEVKGENWYLGNTYHVAIGQGDILATPLQVNAWTNVIANAGKLCRPHLMSNLSHLSTLSNLCEDLGIKKESIDLVREGMREACAPGGTGWPLFKFKVPFDSAQDKQSSTLRLRSGQEFKVDGVDFLEVEEATPSGKNWVHIPVACKTGTAEFGDPKGRTHAWFTAFAPVANPQISVTVLVEGGGEGSYVAAPIAKKIFEAWFGE